MQCFEDLPSHMKEQLGVSCLLSAELSPLVPTIQRELGETVIDILDKLPTKEWMIAGGFMSFIVGHTKKYGDIDVFFNKYVTLEELGDGWEMFATIEDTWLYKFYDYHEFYWNLQSIVSGNRYVIYNHRRTVLQLIVPLKSRPVSFLDNCSDVLMKFDIEYCKVAWIGTNKMIMDLRGIKPERPQHISSRKYREEKYSIRLLNKQLPVPRLSTLSYLKSRGIRVVYTLGSGFGFVRTGVVCCED